MKGDQVWVITKRAAQVLNDSIRQEADESGQWQHRAYHTGTLGRRQAEPSQPRATCLAAARPGGQHTAAPRLFHLCT